LLNQAANRKITITELERPFWHQWAAFVPVIMLGAAVPLLLMGFYPKVRVRFPVRSWG
jgi:hypothetical protein